MTETGQAHRDRIDEDDLVSGARKLAHQVSFGVRVVIPPVFATKTNDRTVQQHASQDFKISKIYKMNPVHPENLFNPVHPLRAPHTTQTHQTADS